MLLTLTTLGSLASALGCIQPKGVLYLSEERRVWVVRSAPNADAQVYRCADGAGVEQPPRPVCVRAALVDQPQ
jgi:hypothetical protein